MRKEFVNHDYTGPDGTRSDSNPQDVNYRNLSPIDTSQVVKFWIAYCISV